MPGSNSKRGSALRFSSKNERSSWRTTYQQDRRFRYQPPSFKCRPLKRTYENESRWEHMPRKMNPQLVNRKSVEDTKPTLNLFDPTLVPKGRNYFEHEDRNGSNRPGITKRFYQTDNDTHTFGKRENKKVSTDEFMWTHDKFEEIEKEIGEKKDVKTK